MIPNFECNFTSSYLPILISDGLKLVFWTCSSFSNIQIQARRTQFKTGTASEASQILSWGSWGCSLSPPAGVLGGGAPSKIFRGFKALKLAY